MRKPFYIWSVFAAVVWIGGHPLADAATRIANTGLRDAIHFLLGLVDPVWFALGAGVVYLATAREQGLPTARRWAAIVIGGVALLLVASVKSTWSLGSILFTDNLSIRLAGVPVALPFFWFAVLLSGRDLLARFLPRASHRALAFGTGLLLLLTDFILEPLAQHERSLWFWYHPVTHIPIATPWQNYLTWFVAGSVLALALRERGVSSRSPSQAASSFPVLAIFQGVFLATHLRRLFLS